jgi:predicted metal-dependent phosphoesterase TrpH
MRCDLHVHSVRSGPVNLPVVGGLGNECYTTPREVYDLALSRGMDLVTISDHDTIEGALEIAHLPEVFVSEEVTVHLPDRRVLHFGALDITEEQHVQMAERSEDPEAFFAYCAETRIPLALNHPFSLSIGQRAAEDFDLALSHVGLVETHNGGMPPETNLCAQATGRAHGLAAVGGSDAHSRRAIGRTWTEVPSARTKAEFLAGLRSGWTVPGGLSGSYARLTQDVLSVVLEGYLHGAGKARHNLKDAARFAALLALSPFLPLVPLMTAIKHLRERRFGLLTFLRWQATTRRPGIRPPIHRLPWMGTELPGISLG